MDYKKDIINGINSLYFDAIEDFKEAEAKIANDSKFRSIFAKKDYKGNIAMLKECRRRANKISFPEKDIPSEDVGSLRIVDKSKEVLLCFVRLCDSYISMQTSLASKAAGEKLPYKEYRRIYDHAMKMHTNMNESMKELDLLYTEYTEENEEVEEGYLTYEMLTGREE